VNPKIVDYKTIRAFESEKSKFDDMVLESICAGWQPFGSPYTVTTGRHTTFFQAMVRYEEEEKEEEEKAEAQEDAKAQKEPEAKEKPHPMTSTTDEHAQTRIGVETAETQRNAEKR
jgi:hypothetical protein